MGRVGFGACVWHGFDGGPRRNRPRPRSVRRPSVRDAGQAWRRRLRSSHSGWTCIAGSSIAMGRVGFGAAATCGNRGLRQIAAVITACERDQMARIRRRPAVPERRRQSMRRNSHGSDAVARRGPQRCGSTGGSAPLAAGGHRVDPGVCARTARATRAVSPSTGARRNANACTGKPGSCPASLPPARRCYGVSIAATRVCTSMPLSSRTGCPAISSS